MPSPFRQLADEGILDTAAGLFARHGFSQTSVQTVATAVGLSKAGLLHHFPTKDALGEAVRQRSEALMDEVVNEVSGLAFGPPRDRLALEILVDQALARPGLVAYCIGLPSGVSIEDGVVGSPIFEAFGLGPGSDRQIRVIGALSALAMLTLVAHEADRGALWRSRIVQTAYDALGHP
jgi:AcrR family transcriptional regulator